MFPIDKYISADLSCVCSDTTKLSKAGQYDEHSEFCNKVEWERKNYLLKIIAIKLKQIQNFWFKNFCHKILPPVS